MRSTLTALILFVSICTIGFFSIPTYKFKPYHKPQKKVPKRDRIDQAWKQEKEMTTDPELGYVPRERLLDAYAYTQNLINGKMGKAAISGVNWVERGPNNCGGRTRAICIDLNDVTRKTVWVGSVAGGLWKTADITATSPIWINQNDFFANMAITSIVQAPGNTQVMYFCTGEGNGNLDAMRGFGVWKSTNGGSTWTQLSSTISSSFNYCQRMFAIGNGDTVFVAAQTGLYRSINGGIAFTKVLGAGISSAIGNEAEDIERMPNGVLYATMSGSASTSGTIHKSYNNGATWTTPLSLGTLTGREIEIAVSNNDTNVIWGIVEQSSQIRAVIRSTNAGVSFDTTTAYPDDADGGISATDFSRGQAWYDLSIAVDPNNSSVCFVGGVDLFKTTNGGGSWQQVSHWYGGFGFQEVHADQHIAIFEPGNSSVVYFGNDGGIYRSTNATATVPTITSKESNYNTAQFYACDIHPTAGSNHFLAGAQDNGSHRFSTTGMNSTSEVTGGDGAFCHIDQNEPSYQFTSYVYNSYYRSTNGGTSFSGTGLTFGSSTGRFINPTDYDDSLNMMYAAYGGGNFMRWSNPQSGNTNTVVTVTALNSVMVSGVKVSPNVAGRIYLGTSGGRVVMVDGANIASGTVAGTQINAGAGMSTGGYVNCIEVEKGNENHIIVVMTNYGIANVWETRNGGTNWVSVDGNLPDMPIRWALMSPTRPHQVLIATELGVWSTDSLMGASTNWQPSVTGLSNTRVDMLKMRTSDKMVIAATHGRGLFSCDVFTATPAAPSVNFIADKSVTYPAVPIQFGSTSSGATSYFWQFGDGTTSTSPNPIKSYSNSGFYNVTLTINSGAASLTKNNFVMVLPFRGVPYLATQGGNFESNQTDFAASSEAGTPFELGFSGIAGKSGTYSGGYAWVTGLLANTYADNSTSYLYTPNFNCTAAGNYTVSFYTKYKTEATWDGFRIEYSIDKGNTWLPLGTSVAANWYDYANTSTGRPFPQNEAYYSNATSMSSFALRTYTTNIFAGQSMVCFRFAFKSDVSLNDAGVAIDNFELNGPNNNPVPVKLIYFNAKRTSNEIAKLTWSTASEKNNKGFEIYKSDETFTKWILVDELPTAANSNQTKNYSFTDEHAGEQSIAYKIKQVDLDGKFTWSNTVVIPPAIQKSSTQLVQLWNMGDKDFGLKLQHAYPATVWIYDAQGREIKVVSLTENATHIPLTDIPNGVYYLHFSQNNQQQIIKVPVF